MRSRRFENRAIMIATLENLHLIAADDARELEDYGFVDSFPLFSSDIDEAILDQHGSNRI